MNLGKCYSLRWLSTAQSRLTATESKTRKEQFPLLKLSKSQGELVVLDSYGCKRAEDTLYSPSNQANLNIRGWEKGYLLCGWVLNTFQHSGAVFASIINAVNCLCFYKS